LQKTVKVHEDTHRALKRLKSEGRKRSMDEVIRDMVRATTGQPVERAREKGRTASLTSYAQG
jgi:predicted CopG family antitoxin